MVLTVYGNAYDIHKFVTNIKFVRLIYSLEYISIGFSAGFWLVAPMRRCFESSTDNHTLQRELISERRDAPK